MQIQATVTVGGVTYPLPNEDTLANNYVTILFTPLLPNPSISTIQTTVSPVSADGIEQDVVTATIYNTAGQLVGAGDTVTFSVPIPNGNNVVYTATAYTNAQGVATAYFTSTQVLTASVQATVNVAGVPSVPIPWAGNSLLNYTDIAFVPTGVDPAKSYIQVIQNS